jgi:hypothetical protein
VPAAPGAPGRPSRAQYHHGDEHQQRRRRLVAGLNSFAAGDTIDFSPGLSGTITLASNLSTIFNNVTITGPGADLLTISGNNRFTAC